MKILRLSAFAGVFGLFCINDLNAVSVGPVQQPDPTISYVSMPMPAKPETMSLTVKGAIGQKRTLNSIADTMKEFIERMSRRKIVLETRVSTNDGKNLQRLGDTQEGEFNVADKSKLLILKPGAQSRVPVIGNAISAKHELGHEFGLGHAAIRMWKSQTQVGVWAGEKDPYDPMTTMPGKDSFNAPHLHALEWFSDTEEAYAEVGKEYILTLLNTRSTEFKSLKALFYKLPDSTRTYWFSYVKLGKKTRVPKGMPGTGVAMHSGLHGGRGTYLEGMIGMTPTTQIRNGLILVLSDPTPTTVRVKVELDPTWRLKSGGDDNAEEAAVDAAVK